MPSVNERKKGGGKVEVDTLVGENLPTFVHFTTAERLRRMGIYLHTLAIKSFGAPASFTFHRRDINHLASC